METIFVIGMFKSQSIRFAAECKRRGIRYRSVLADVGKRGDMVLVPTPKDAVYEFRDWVKAEDEAYENLHIILLPYCEATDELVDELDAAVDLGATLIDPLCGENGWPAALSRKVKPDTSFYNNFFEQIVMLLPVVTVPEVSVSDYYKNKALENPGLIFSPSVFQTCNEIASHRKSFMREAIDALVELLVEPPGCRVDAFFRAKGIEHAQTGGISTYLDVIGLDTFTSEMHLKKGDKTSSAAAVRIYYHLIHHNETNYVIILYAGPHPESDVRWQLRLPSTTS